MIQSAATDGRFALIEHTIAPRALAAPLHVHEREDEYSYVLSGRMGAQIGDDVVEAGAGELVLKPRGIPHAFWNASAEETHVVVEVRPGQRFEQMIRQTFLAAQDGRTDAKGRPRPLQGAMLLREFADTMVLTSPPPAVQKLLLGLLHPIARLTGHRAIDPEYAARELPVVDLEPLPPAIVERIPGLAMPLAVES
jgi:mannose-6-phosphate isomerase-like protein (cupin superfamily)